MTRRLLVSISAHGFGHAAQTAVVVNALWERRPDLQVTLRTALPRAVLEGFFSRGFELIERADDVGMVMASPLTVLAEETAAAYQDLHRGWQERVEAEAAALTRLAPDLVLANVPYLTVAATARAGIPAVAMSSLNWAELYWDFFADRPEAARIRDEMITAYRRAEVFLLPEPSMPMTWLPNRRRIGTLARIGTPRRRELATILSATDEQRLVLVAFGGIAGTRVPAALPRAPNVIWLTDGGPQDGRPDVASFTALAWPFPDLLRSVDAVVTKPGYGTLAEAACNGTRVLYLCRGDWAEERYLVDWLERHAVCREIEPGELAGDRLLPVLRDLLARPAKSGPAATGGADAAEILADLLA
jgi:hypothetical protein